MITRELISLNPSLHKYTINFVIYIKNNNTLLFVEITLDVFLKKIKDEANIFKRETQVYTQILINILQHSNVLNKGTQTNCGLKFTWQAAEIICKKHRHQKLQKYLRVLFFFYVFYFFHFLSFKNFELQSAKQVL